MAVFSLPPEADSDEYWQWHTTVHAPQSVKAAGSGLKRYVLNRVVQTVAGEPKFYAIVETWWEDEEAIRKAGEAYQLMTTPDGESFVQSFRSRITDFCNVLVEEKVIK